MTNTQTNNNISSEEITVNTTDNLIEALVSHFQDNPQGFTDYRKEVESLLKENIKPLTARSGKAGDNWRSEVKSQFSGRGAFIQGNAESCCLRRIRAIREHSQVETCFPNRLMHSRGQGCGHRDRVEALSLR